jgi:hypothetical protein
MTSSERQVLAAAQMALVAGLLLVGGMVAWRRLA